jgi:hypothetical protein
VAAAGCSEQVEFAGLNKGLQTISTSDRFFCFQATLTAKPTNWVQASSDMWPWPDDEVDCVPAVPLQETGSVDCKVFFILFLFFYIN